MRKTAISLIALFVLNLSLGPLMSSPRAAVPGGGAPLQAAVLTNADVLMMLKMGLSSEVIIAKIKVSNCSFDTSPAALQELKNAKASDPLIMAMMLPSAPAPAAAATAAPTAAAQPALVEMRIPDGTEIEVELKNNVSGQDANVGDIVDFVVVRPVQVNGVTIIDKGAPARARITTAKKAGHWGKAGKLEWAMQDVQAIDGSRLPSRFTKRDVGASSGNTVAVAAVATTVLLGPVGLLWGLKKGKAALIPAGNRYTVFVHGDMTMKGRQ